MENNYGNLIGRSKDAVLHMLDQPVTPYDSDEWVYILQEKTFLDLRRGCTCSLRITGFTIIS